MDLGSGGLRTDWWGHGGDGLRTDLGGQYAGGGIGGGVQVEVSPSAPEGGMGMYSGYQNNSSLHHPYFWGQIVGQHQTPPRPHILPAFCEGCRSWGRLLI